MAAGAARWPLGLICCFGLLIFLVAASIVLALIPVYLPKHGSDIQPLKSPEQFAYLQYSGTAENGVAGSPNNIDDINKDFTNQVGVSNNVVNANRVEVIENPSRKRKRHTLKSSLVPRKRQVITFQILIVIQIVYPITCQRLTCQNRMRGNVENQISSRPSITLSFTFIGITTGPIRFSLIFIGFFLTIPNIFNNPSGGRTSTRSSTAATVSSTTASTTTASTTTVTPEATTIGESTVVTTVTIATTTVATTPITTTATSTLTTAETVTIPTSASGESTTGSSESIGTGVTIATTSSETTGTNTPATGSSVTIETKTPSITSSSETTGTGLATVTSTETTETGIPTTGSPQSPATETTGTSTGTGFITSTENEGSNTTQTISISTSEELPGTSDITEITISSSITPTTTTEPGLTSDLIDTITTLETTISTTGSLTATPTTIPISGTTPHVTSEISNNTDIVTTAAPITDTSTSETPGLTSDIIDWSGSTPVITSTSETPEFTSDLIDWTDSSSTITNTPQLTTDQTGATSASNPATTVADQCSADVRQGLEWFSLYGLITIQDFSTTSNVKNRAIVCGSYTSSQSGDFGESVTTNPSPTNFTLQINGNLVSGNPINMNKGSLGLGTNPSHTISSSSNTQATVDGRLINLNQGNEGANARVDDNLSDTCQSITTSLLSLSQRLSQLSNTSGNTIDLPGSQPSGANININAIDGNGISVISLDGNTLLNNNNVQSIQVVIDSSVSSDLQLVVINLSGTSITFGGGSNLGGSWLQSSEGRSRTIWNLYEATTFNNNNGKAWMGSTLAPNAAMTQNGQTTGAVAVKTLTSSASIDSPLVIVPECI